jgi:hypothetical protein
MHRRWVKIARKCDKITAPIEGQPLIHKARKIAWKHTTLSIQKVGYTEVYGYGRRIIHCDNSCRLNFGVHRLHSGGNRGDLLVAAVPKECHVIWSKYFGLRRKQKENLSIAYRSPRSAFAVCARVPLYREILDKDNWICNQFCINRRWVTVSKY